MDLLNGGVFTGATTATLTINPANVADAAPDYNVVVSGACSPGITSSNTSLFVNPTPLAVPGSNSPVCTNSSINLTAQTVSGATYAWTGPNGYASSTQNPVITSGSSATVDTYSLTVSSNVCTSPISTVTVVVNNCTDLTVVKTVNSAHPIIGHTIIFTIVATNNGPNNATGVTVTDMLQSGYTYVSSTATTGTYDASTGIWTIGSLNNGKSETLTITVTVNASGDYVNTATIDDDVDGHNSTFSSIETQPTDFNIPEGFSPNGDGINDLFVIRGIENYSNNTFVVFNRWGSKVFDASPYQNTWGGQSTKGVKVGSDELPVGTYFYTLKLGDGSDPIKGTIYLNK